MDLCTICANTQASNVALNVIRVSEMNHAKLLSTICYVGNAILAAIKEKR
jgi:hypothetical protein